MAEQDEAWVLQDALTYLEEVMAEALHRGLTMTSDLLAEVVQGLEKDEAASPFILPEDGAGPSLTRTAG